MSIHCSITTPEKLVYEGTARMVVVPSSDGELGILPNHAALMSLLGVGELRLEAENGGQSSFFVSVGSSAATPRPPQPTTARLRSTATRA